jgi:transposase
MTGAEIAHDFGVSTSSIKRWLGQADITDGVTTGEQNELVQLRRRNRLLEQGVEILRRATVDFAKDAAPRRCTRWSKTLPATGSPSR